MEWYAAYLTLGAIAGFLAGLFGVAAGWCWYPCCSCCSTRNIFQLSM